MDETTPDSNSEFAAESPSAQPIEVVPLEGCELSLEYSDRVNYAMRQRGTPLVEAVTIANRSEHEFPEGTLRLSVASGECEAWSRAISAIAPGSAVRVIPDDWSLLPEKLGERTEAERTTIHAEYQAGDAGVRTKGDLDVLAFDQWPGALYHPETTAAFVTPNHSLIAELLGRAREILEERGESGSLDGYQSASRQRSARLAEACVLALAERGIGYIQPPASFEKNGQRVRLVDRVLRERLGTCLDLSLVILSLWEQCGLHGLLLLPEKHALPAFWTRETRLPELTVDDAARIRNLMHLGDIVPVESTLLTKEGQTFEAMAASGREKIESPGEGFLAIDIASARKRGVRPLPLRDEGLGEAVRAESGSAPSDAPATTLDSVLLAERADRSMGEETVSEAESPAGRIERWQSRLLDLSLRNRLLNYRQSGRTIELDVPDLALFEDRLADDGAFEILAKSETTDEYLREELSAGRVYADQPLAETQKRLLTIYRLARSSVEETGANLLHLALGQLSWYETDQAERERISPLILLPVELRRSSSGGGYAYTVRLSNEPIRPNVTLLEKLRTEYGIETSALEELPEDESGVDVPMVLRGFREAIRGMRRWEVRETASLGLFSFNKFLMWRDLRENLEQLKENRLVHHLVTTPGEAFAPEPFPDPSVLDDELEPGELFCTRDADSSQMRAILAAARGRSFVLEGPPGTGKSQTIANMIANALAHGKRVLFVAEKMAALSVVRKRLEQDGLGAHCLELHSSKASKKEVLAQLARSLEERASGMPGDWDDLCAELGQTRGALNVYVRELHRVRESGESLYEVIGRLAELGEREHLPIEFEGVEGTSAEQLARWRKLVDGLVDRSAGVDPVHRHPLRGVGLCAWSFGVEDAISASLSRAIEAGERASGAAQDAARAMPGLDSGVWLSKADCEFLAELAELTPACPVPPRELVAPGSDASSMRDRLRDVIALGRERDALNADLDARYEREFLDIPHLEWLDRVRRASAQIALFRWVRHKLIARKLRVYAKGKVTGLSVLESDLQKARRVKELESSLGEVDRVSRKVIGEGAPGKTDWNRVQEVLEWSERYAELTQRGKASGTDDRVIRAATELVSTEPVLRSAQPVFERYQLAWSEWVRAWSGVTERVQPEEESHASAEIQDGYLPSMCAVMERWRDHLGELSTWTAWREARDAAMDEPVRAIVRAYEAGGLGRDALGDAFEYSYGEQWFVAVANRVEAIRGFRMDQHERRIERFRDLDTTVIERTERVVGARLGRRSPTIAAEASSRSEVGILRREIEKKRRHLPTRRLLESIPGLAASLKPCFLMSPLSVAQYLGDRLPKFDLVVFDEASQIPVWDAIGAIARGREVVVVGDSKQLPPTTFFDAMESDDAFVEDEAVEDMESVLKECNASGVPSLVLGWHYRSRHESLIAFSNRQYYGNELHTFPSPVERSAELGVSFRLVEGGVYDRGGTRTNRIEAEAVVEHVVGMLRTPGESGSIGIVTFNQAQQTLIEDLLDAKRREEPALDAFFGGHLDEGVFVKNLENVQGDERDTIIFSVGYGPDAEGKVSMNFGPLNKEGGERRLNVAITRAKRRLMVFSSMTADAIDLRRTGAVGVRDFRHFLDYAQHGVLTADPTQTEQHGERAQGAFVRAVRRELEARGWDVDTSVGYAGYRIDLAVRDPEHPGRHLIGIECDGRTYAKANTARDRDRTRSAVLKGLGWKLARVWSVQWRINKERCIEDLVSAVESAQRGDAVEEQAEAQRAAEVRTPEMQSPEALPAASGDDAVTGVYVASRKPDRARVSDESDPKSVARLRDWAASVIEQEQPVVREVVIRRLASWCDRQQVTSRFRGVVDGIVDELVLCGRVTERGDALLLAGGDSEIVVRSPGRDEATKRDPEWIPEVEIERAVFVTLERQFGMPREDLCREAGRLLGFDRSVGRIRTRVLDVIEALLGRGEIREEGETIRLGTRL